jgi:hypothetical protein
MTRRFGRKLKLPSTVAIKHAILRLMVQDELQAHAAKAEEERSSLLTGRGRAETLNGIATPC